MNCLQHSVESYNKQQMYCMLKVGYKTRAAISNCPDHSANQAVLTMVQSKHITIIVDSCPIQQARVRNSLSKF